MSTTARIYKALLGLNAFIKQFTKPTPVWDNSVAFNELFFNGFKHQLKLAEESNSWFTQQNLQFALQQWHEQLQEESLLKWINSYNITPIASKTIAIVAAGNIPLVGFHDLLCALVAGHSVLIKLSHNDKHLLPFLTRYLEHIEPSLKGRIKYSSEKLDYFDAVIATGSNNTARYFEYYFRTKPAIIRKNRNSVAVLSGKETEDQLKALSDDIFRYYGLGCRSVSKLFVPQDYNFDAFFKAMYHWHPIINESKYANNYDYNKAVYLMSEFNILENGFLMLKEDKSNASPIASLFYEYYNSASELKVRLNSISEHIQVIVADGFSENEIAFGTTQKPQLNDYADGIDTVSFLLNL